MSHSDYPDTARLVHDEAFCETLAVSLRAEGVHVPGDTLQASAAHLSHGLREALQPAA